jgi:hypothetical protein
MIKMNKNLKKIVGICAILPLLLTACGTKTMVQNDSSQKTAQTDTSGNASQADASQTNAPRASMNPNAVLMMTTFRGLIQMDKTDGLAITKEQAKPMLTIVQDVNSKGELTAEVQTQLEVNLTADQKKFLEDNATKVPQRPAGGKGNGNGQNPQGGANGNARPNGNAPQGGAGGQNPQGSPRPNGNGNGGPGAGGPGGGFGNTGQQLIDLLQAKLQ